MIDVDWRERQVTHDVTVIIIRDFESKLILPPGLARVYCGKAKAIVACVVKGSFAKHESLTVNDRDRIDGIALHLQLPSGPMLDVKEISLSLTIVVVIEIEAEIRLRSIVSDRPPSGRKTERGIKHHKNGRLRAALIELSDDLDRNFVYVDCDVRERRSRCRRASRPAAGSSDRLFQR